MSVWLYEELVIFALEMKYGNLFMSLCSFLLILYWRRMYDPLLTVFNRYWYFHINHCLWFILQVYLKYIEYCSNHRSDFYFVNKQALFFFLLKYTIKNIILKLWRLIVYLLHRIFKESSWTFGLLISSLPSF